MQHVASQNIEPNTEPNLRYSTVYFLKERVYCGSSQWKKKIAELKKPKLRNLIIFQISYVLEYSDNMSQIAKKR